MSDIAAVPPFFVEVLVVLCATVVAVPIAKRVGLGSVIGYIAAGMAIGPAGLDFLHSSESVLNVAEIGVVLLLFVIGLELDPQRLWKMKRDIFGLGTAQVVLTGLALFALIRLYGQSTTIALIAGFGLALSSTAFALQILQERGQLSAPYGQRAFGILLLQDMAIVPLLAMVSFLAVGIEGGAATIDVWQVAITLGSILAMLLAGRYVLPSLFVVLSGGGREVMLAAALLVALGSAALMHAVGLSMALGAFLAGVVLAESSFRHTLHADIEPFRSLLMGLFFVGVGMSLDLSAVMTRWQSVLLGVLAVMLVKGMFLWALARVSGSGNSDALRIAVTLPQGGEFAFVLFGTATASGLLSRDASSMLGSLVIVTMILTPVACLGLDWLASFLKEKGAEHPVIESFDDAAPAVLVVGFGRFGMSVAQMLTDEGVSITAIDHRPYRIAYARKLGYRVYYGDATRPDVLAAAGADKATLIALCIENDKVISQAVTLIKGRFPEARLFCRATDRAHALTLTKLGVDFQIRETFESSVAFGRAALATLGIPAERIDQIERHLRDQDSERLRTELEADSTAKSEG